MAKNTSEFPNGDVSLNSNAILSAFQDGQTRHLTASNVVFGSKVVSVYSEADLPLATNGFIQLDPLTSYQFMNPGILIGTPILLPAGYIGYFENTFLDDFGVVYTGGASTTFIQTLNLEGTYSSIVDSDPGVTITVTSIAHGILDGQYVNMKNAAINDLYNGDRKQVSNVTDDTFDVPGAFTVTDSGDWDTGYQAFQFRNFVTAAFSVFHRTLNVTSSGDEKYLSIYFICHDYICSPCF